MYPFADQPVSRSTKVSRFKGKEKVKPFWVIVKNLEILEQHKKRAKHEVGYKSLARAREMMARFAERQAMDTEEGKKAVIRSIKKAREALLAKYPSEALKKVPLKIREKKRNAEIERKAKAKAEAVEFLSRTSN